MNKQEILKNRAKQLLLEEKIETSKLIKGVKFSLNDEIYLIEYACIEEITNINEITPLQNVPAIILGLTSVRSQVVTLIDLKSLFQLEKKTPKKAILLNDGMMRFAIAADEVLGPGEIDESTLQTKLSTLTIEKQSLLKGFTASGISLLDGKKILHSPYFKVNEEGSYG